MLVNNLRVMWFSTKITLALFFTIPFGYSGGKQYGSVIVILYMYKFNTHFTHLRTGHVNRMPSGTARGQGPGTSMLRVFMLQM